MTAVALGFALGVCVTVAIGLALRIHRDSAVCAEWERTWEAECRRHDATLAQLHQLQAQSDAAAVSIVRLSHALHTAAAQVQEARSETCIVAPHTAAAMKFWVN